MLIDKELFSIVEEQLIKNADRAKTRYIKTHHTIY